MRGFEQTFRLISGNVQALLKTVVDLLSRCGEARPHEIEEALLGVEIKSRAAVDIYADKG